MELIIRPATPNDLPTLLNFEQSLINSERPFDETMISEEFHYYDLALLIEDPEADMSGLSKAIITISSKDLPFLDLCTLNQNNEERGSIR